MKFEDGEYTMTVTQDSSVYIAKTGDRSYSIQGSITNGYFNIHRPDSQKKNGGWGFPLMILKRLKKLGIKMIRVEVIYMKIGKTGWSMSVKYFLMDGFKLRKRYKAGERKTFKDDIAGKCVRFLETDMKEER